MCQVCEKVKKAIKKANYYTGYIPVPVWNGKEWEPTASSLGGVPMCWPEGLDTTTLPRPLYQLGDIVTFNWSSCVIYEGHILRIKLHGGAYFYHDGPAIKACEKRYTSEGMSYTIVAKGHGRWVREDKIIAKVGTKFNPVA